MTNWLLSVHSSFILPSSTRKMLIPRPSAIFPVAFKPFPLPVFVPRPLHTTVTKSPSAISLSMVNSKVPGGLMIHKVFGVDLRRHLEPSLRKDIGEDPAHNRLVLVGTQVLPEDRRDGDYRHYCCNQDPIHVKLLLVRIPHPS